MCINNIFKLFRKRNILDFNLNYRPKYSFRDYLYIIKDSNCFSKSSLIISLIYLERLHNCSEFQKCYTINKSNVHLFYLIGCIISEKYLEDDYLPFCYIFNKIGLTINELKNLENKYLKLIKWKLFVDLNQFYKLTDLLIENSIVIMYNLDKQTETEDFINNDNLFLSINSYINLKFLAKDI